MQLRVLALLFVFELYCQECRGLVIPQKLSLQLLSFARYTPCSYSYELAVHTARGSRSTESDGFQLHALVSQAKLE